MSSFCYVARMPGCCCIAAVCADMADMPKETAKFCAQSVRDGFILERMETEKFRNSTDSMGCAKHLKMKDCRKQGLNAKTE